MNAPRITRRATLALAGAAALGTPAPARAQTPLRIGYQKAAVNLMLAREHELVEARLPGTPLAWIEFPAGPQLLEALALGGVDFGFTGDTPPVFAQAAGRDLLYAGLEPPKPASSALLVPAASPLRTLADLKGRRVAFQKGSSAHYLVVRAVAKAGLRWSDIEPVTLAPADARAAFEHGAIDAWGIWDPYYAAAEIDGHARVLATGHGLSNNNSFYLASRALVRQPRTVAALFAALGDADARAHANPPETAAFLAAASGLPPAVTQRFLARRTAGPVRPLSEADIADQQRVADAFAELKLIPKPLRVADVVWRAHES